MHKHTTYNALAWSTIQVIVRFLRRPPDWLERQGRCLRDEKKKKKVERNHLPSEAARATLSPIAQKKKTRCCFVCAFRLKSRDHHNRPFPWCSSGDSEPLLCEFSLPESCADRLLNSHRRARLFSIVSVAWEGKHLLGVRASSHPFDTCFCHCMRAAFLELR